MKLSRRDNEINEVYFSRLKTEDKRAVLLAVS